MTYGVFPPTAGGGGIDQLTGDVLAGPGSGSQPATVVGLQGSPIANVAPNAGELLAWNGAFWVPTAPSGGGGPAPPILPSNTYVWACGDPAGSLTLANTGQNQTPGSELTLVGTQTLQSGRISRSSKSVYFEAAASSDVAKSTSILAPLASGVTIEVFAIFDLAPFNNGCSIFEVASNTGNSNYLLIGADNNGIRTNVGIYGAFDTQSNVYPLVRGVPTYLAATYQAQVMQFFVNGRLYAINQTGNLTQDFTIAALANLARPNLQAYPLSGNIMQARISNVVQPASYFRSNADTLFKM